MAHWCENEPKRRGLGFRAGSPERRGEYRSVTKFPRCVHRMVHAHKIEERRQEMSFHRRVLRDRNSVRCSIVLRAAFRALLAIPFLGVLLMVGSLCAQVEKATL